MPSGYTPINRRLRVMLFGLSVMIMATPAAADPRMPPVAATKLENHLGLTFSPCGKQAFWVAWDGKWGSGAGSNQVIYTSRRVSGVWSEPAPAPFSGEYSDSDPFVSPDGQWLYFVSTRPAGVPDDEQDADIWRYSLADEGRPERLAINSPAAEYSPVVTASGSLYFASARQGGTGQGDLYCAAPVAGGFAPARLLGPALNSPTGEWNLWVSPDETEMIFEASERTTNVSAAGDLYYSWRTDADWTAATPIRALNSRDSDLMPRLHPDGELLVYTTAPIGGHARIVTADWTTLRTQLRAPDR